MVLEQLPISKDLTLFTNATFRKSFKWYSANQPVDLTGWDAWFTYGQTSTASIGELTVASNNIELGADGTIQIYMSDEETKAFGESLGAVTSSARVLFYQLSLESDIGDTIVFMRGRLNLVYSMSRP